MTDPVSPADRGEFMKPSSPALSPCPFCGGKPAFVIGMKQTVRTVDVICQDCGGAMPAFCEDDAAADWNTRPTPSSVSAPAQDATALREAIQRGCDAVNKELEEQRSTPSASAGPQAEALTEAMVHLQMTIEGTKKCRDTRPAVYTFESNNPLTIGDLRAIYAALAHPQPQQADGRGVVIEALTHAESFLANFTSVRPCVHIDPRDILNKVRAALQQRTDPPNE